MTHVHTRHSHSDATTRGKRTHTSTRPTGRRRLHLAARARSSGTRPSCRASRGAPSRRRPRHPRLRPQRPRPAPLRPYPWALWDCCRRSRARLRSPGTRTCVDEQLRPIIICIVHPYRLSALLNTNKYVVLYNQQCTQYMYQQPDNFRAVTRYI